MTLVLYFYCQRPPIVETNKIDSLHFFSSKKYNIIFLKLSAVVKINKIVILFARFRQH